jgi:hypothetical protein
MPHHPRDVAEHLPHLWAQLVTRQGDGEDSQALGANRHRQIHHQHRSAHSSGRGPGRGGLSRVIQHGGDSTLLAVGRPRRAIHQVLRADMRDGRTTRDRFQTSFGIVGQKQNTSLRRHMPGQPA